MFRHVARPFMFKLHTAPFVTLMATNLEPLYRAVLVCMLFINLFCGNMVHGVGCPRHWVHHPPRCTGPLFATQGNCRSSCFDFACQYRCVFLTSRFTMRQALESVVPCTSLCLAFLFLVAYAVPDLPSALASKSTSRL